MISKREYQKTLIRMWDSVRDNDFKGNEDCNGIECNNCPIVSMCSDVEMQWIMMYYYLYNS